MHSVNLSQAVRMWPTPQAHKITRSGEIVNTDGTEWDGLSKPHSKTTGRPITTALADAVAMFPTPTANEDKDQNASFATLARLDKGGRILRRIATLAMRGNGQVGQSNLNDGGNRRERLNPAWVESLLGLPSSWTDCASSETESCQQPPLSPSAL